MFPLGSRWMKLGLLVASVVTVSGCGSDTGKMVVIGKVSGTVTLEGESVEKGCVLTFFPQSAGAEIASALIRDDGTYVATSGKYAGIPIGQYRVTVSPPKMDPKEQDELAKKNTATTMKALMTADKKELQKLEYPQDAIIPRKYWIEATSGLTITVKEGENVTNFKLSTNTKR